MDITKLASQAEEDALAEALEDKYVSEVSNRMRDIETVNKPDMKRWVWELIQNAKDSIASNPNYSGVDIRFKINGDIMEFSHNGAPFTHKARIALMYKHSSGKDNHQTTGRFGTGFLTTHRLSKIVDVKSNVIDRQGNISGFKFTLYRNGNTQDELREGLQKMRESREWIKPQEWTTFRYQITDDMGRDSLKLGIESFHSLIAPTMIFCPEINSVTFDNNGKCTYISRGESSTLRNDVKKIELNIQNDENVQNKVFLIVEESNTLSNNNVASVKMIVEVTKDFSIISHGNNCGFFCSLPLEGIEQQLVEPFIVNSESFESTTERQRLRLSGASFREDGSLSIMGINKVIYTTILSLFKRLSTYLVEEGYKNSHFIANGLKSIKSGAEELDEKWYKENVQEKYRNIIKELPIVRNLNHIKVHLKDSIILKGKQDEIPLLTDLLVKVYPNQLIEDNNAWSNVIWKDDDIRVWDIADFCEHISSTYSNWNDIPNLSDAGLAEWYNNFLSLVISHDEGLLKKYALLPDMYGNLHKNDDSLKQNVNISVQALDILNKLGKDKKSELLHHNITALKLEREYNSTSAAADFNKRVEEICKEIGWLGKLMPLMSAVPTDSNKYPNHLGFCEKRRNFLKIAKDLYGYQIEEVEENSLIADSWRELDKQFINASLRKISGLGKISELPSGLDVDWLNSALVVLNPTPEQWKEYALLPNQYGVLKKKEEVYIDRGIEKELKAEILKTVYINPKSYLLDPAINAQELGVEKSKGTSDVVSDLRSLFESVPLYNDNFTHKNYGRYYKYPLQTLLPISRYIVSLLPADKDSEQFEFQDEFLKVSDFLSDQDITYNGSIQYSNGDLWSIPNLLVAKNVFELLEKDKSIEGTSQRLGEIGTKRVIDSLNEFYEILGKLRIGYDSHSIIPNQHGIYCKLSDLFDESSDRDEELKDIANEIPEGQDFRQILIHPSITINCGIAKSNEEIAKFIDETIARLYRDSLNWQNDQFRNAVTKFIEIWAPKHTLLFEKCNLTNAQKDTITVTVIYTPELRSRVQAIARTGTSIEIIEKAAENAKKVAELEAEIADLKNLNSVLKDCPPDKLAQVKDIISKLATEEVTIDNGETPIGGEDEMEMVVVPKIHEIETENFEGQTQIVKIDQVQYAGLSLDEIEKYVGEAKDAVVKYFKERNEKHNSGYQFDDEKIAKHSFSQLYGISDKNGNEIPIVVHSYKGPQYRYFDLNWYDWQLLSKKGAMLFVVTVTGLQCIPLYALPVRNFNIPIKNDMSNETRAALLTLAAVGKEYANISFNFGNNMPQGFKDPVPFDYVPEQLGACISSIKEVCDKNIPQIANMYNSGKNVALVRSAVGYSIALSDIDAGKARDIFEAPANGTVPPSVGTAFID